MGRGTQFAFVTAILVSGLTFPSFAQPVPAQEKIISIGTGPVNGIYYPAGGAICRLMNRNRKDTGLRCFAESTSGSLNNIQSLKSGDVSFAITQGDWQYKAYHGDPAFKGAAFTDMRSVFSLYTEMFTVAVAKNSGIHNLQGLKGKRVNTGDPGSGTKDMLEAIAGSFRWKPDCFGHTTELKPMDAAQALCDGKIDAMVVAMGNPNGVVQEVTSNCGARLIPIDGAGVDTLLSQDPYYTRVVIPGGMYRGNAQDVPTFGVKASLVTTTAMDDETVYQLTKAVFENFDNFKTLHFAFATLDREKMASSGLVAPLHPGAARYFHEAGLLKAEQETKPASQ